jgi:hypothetical protein
MQSPENSHRQYGPRTWALILLFGMLLAVAGCNAQPRPPAEVETTAYETVDSVLLQYLDSRQDEGGTFQHENLHVVRWDEKDLTANPLDESVSAAWCVGVGYDIAATSGDEAGVWRSAEIIVRVIQTTKNTLAGMEWTPEPTDNSINSLEEYNDFAWEDCLNS